MGVERLVTAAGVVVVGVVTIIRNGIISSELPWSGSGGSSPLERVLLVVAVVGGGCGAIESGSGGDERDESGNGEKKRVISAGSNARKTLVHDATMSGALGLIGSNERRDVNPSEEAPNCKDGIEREFSGRRRRQTWQNAGLQGCKDGISA
ncbi:hypothetical protein C8F04DRAFT_1238472 [Mycena alexandri]|uniref:Uncharacterized protein n=1 Tax=Mycena alexandri TaxID=1745969 RepID=A0AAD6SFK1_9AGAR|nr:hypothetical protein C8F04DRAFT_1238472 [Mycena alexandri]